MLKITEIIENLKVEFGFQGHGSDKKIAELFDIPKVKVANWRLRDTIDLKLLTKKLKPEQFLRVVYGQQTAPLPNKTPSEIKAKIVIDDCLNDLNIQILDKEPEKTLYHKLIEVLSDGMESEQKPLEQWKNECKRQIQLIWNE